MFMNSTTELGEDILDLRDILDRIADLEVEIGSDEENDDDQEELAYLNGFVEEILGNFGGGDIASVAAEESTLINRAYWETYAEMLAGDLGLTNDLAEWPNNHIDWEAAAEELEQDYISFDYDGYEYLIRSY